MNQFPREIAQIVKRRLQETGDSSDIVEIQAVSGGYINRVVRIDTHKCRYLLKWNEEPLPGLFSCEAQGLEKLSSTHTVKVPAVLAVGEHENRRPGYILLEWLEGPEGVKANYEVLGRQVALLHKNDVPLQPSCAYGLENDNYQGPARQYNGWDSDWVNFYVEKRLVPQMETCYRKGYLSVWRRKKLEWICNNLGRWLTNVERRPSLLHGDLWQGNVLVAPDGEPALIDPAVYYGDREAEIAYTQIFNGSFEPAFYLAYDEFWRLEPGFEERRDLYNLYHMINHVNIFGEEYGAFLDGVLQRYAGSD